MRILKENYIPIFLIILFSVSSLFLYKTELEGSFTSTTTKLLEEVNQEKETTAKKTAKFLLEEDTSGKVLPAFKLEEQTDTEILMDLENNMKFLTDVLAKELN